MKKIVRIIATFHPFGGRLTPANAYIFCLPPAAMSRLDEVMEEMRYAAPQAVQQFACDEAGLLIYTKEFTNNVGTFSTCEAVLSIINRVLQTGLEFDPTPSKGSFFLVRNYGHWEGATTYAELQQDPRFVLPYMKATPTPSA